MTHSLFAPPVPIEVPGQLAALVERLKSAIAAVNNAGSLEHRRARVAAQHLEFEIAPLVESLDLEGEIKKIGEAAIAAQQRVILPLSTELRLQFGQTAQITTHPQWHGLQIFKISCAPGFMIHDIKIGNRSQFEQAGSIRSEDLHDRELLLDPLHSLMEIVLIVEYVGPDPEGAAFRASAEARIVSFPSAQVPNRIEVTS